MNKEEIIKNLVEKFNVSEEEATNVLEMNNWDIIEAGVYFKNRENNTQKEKIDLSKDSENNYNNGNCSSNCEGDTTSFSKLLGKFSRFMCNLIEKGNRNYFQFGKNGSKPCKLQITALVILLIIAFWPVAILLIVGLFLGYKYSFFGPNINGNKANDFMNKAYNKAQNIKSDFNEGYNNK